MATTETMSATEHPEWDREVDRCACRPGNAASAPAVGRFLDKGAAKTELTGSELSFLMSASNIMESVCQDGEYRGMNLRSRTTDEFFDPLLQDGRAQYTNVVEFLCCCQDTAKWSVEVNVVAVILAVRFSRKHPVNWGNWERVLLIALLLGQKIVDDHALCNMDFPEVYRLYDDFDRGDRRSWQKRSRLSLRRLNALELAFLKTIEHNLYVGFSHAAFLMLEPSQQVNERHRAELMDVVATGKMKLEMPRYLGLIPCVINNDFKFLMVDDDMMNRLIMSQKLTTAKEFKGLSAVCDQAEHGEAALQKLKANSEGYDVLIFDEHMENSGGKLKGSEVIRQLRQEGCKSVIVSCSVSCNDDTNYSAFKSAGADICWTKPYPSPMQMYHDLGQFLHQHPHF
jgi:CheY-like chemotaxis protein